MQSELTYHRLPTTDRVSEDVNKGGKFLEILDARIEQYVGQLKEFEIRAAASGADGAKLIAEIIAMNDSVLAACAEFEKAVPYEADAIRDARIRFREKTGPILTKSNFISHARTWPRGHQGDYQILESAYRNMSSSSGIGYYLDRYCLQTTLCVAVRERKNTLQDILKAEMAARTGPRILDVACGSCRDLFEIAADVEKTGARVTCVDFDSEALEFAANRMAIANSASELITYRKYNAFKMINHERNLKEFGSQDLIYSVGFFDYLKDDMLIRLLGALYELLSPGGRLIASFKDCKNYNPQFYRWMVDWDGFFLRTEEDCREIIQKAGIPSGSVAFQRDKTEVIMFFTATR